MAKEYKDQILDTLVNEKRVYNIVDSDGNIVAENVSLEDKTVYSQEGTEFGAQEVNEIYEAIDEVNQSLNYSANEQAVGKWYDGKTLYRKLFTFNNGSETTYNYATDLVNDNVDIVFVGQESFLINGVVYNPVNCAHSGSNDASGMTLSKHKSGYINIGVRNGSNNINCDYTVFLYYTKNE